ncbi:DUF4252 domain-containing protein [Catalinimonas niigatensis]|uniref:DUF4252 domain-containing protein n=1 Tax=Catalinimonas niigatensis TaxID=1397264 RepID=UPI0026654541|nr:DUF4252 domain-containing protein [Catalinimonas niigatensis]WPP52325.1 DUF4252 domain-containing protein [Catalinimonas niigatensis]
MKAFLITAFALLLFCFEINAQSKTVARFLEKHKPSTSFYFYPSTLRMINRENNPDYQRLVRNIEKLSFLTFEKKNANLSSSDFQNLKKQLASEKFEELFTMNDQKNHIYVYVQGDDPEAYISVVESDSSLMLFDMQGAPHLPSLMKLIQSDFNFGKVAELSSQFFKDDDEVEVKNQPK